MTTTDGPMPQAAGPRARRRFGARMFGTGTFGAGPFGGPPALAVSVFATAMCFRSFELLSHPRFLAEEAFTYYQYMQHSSFLDGLCFVFRGNYQLLTNLICLAAVAAPDLYAAFPTTYLGAAFDAYACLLLAEALACRGASPATVGLSVLGFALQPAGYEVFLNATNVMWVCSACTLMIALSEERAPRCARAWLAYGSVLAFGLTGVPSLTLLPFYALKALARRTAYRAALLATLVGAAAVQAAVVLHHDPDPDRTMALTWHSVAPAVLQTTLIDLVPAAAVDVLAKRIVVYDRDGAVIAAQATLLGLGLVAVALAGAWRALSPIDRAVIPGAIAFVSAFDTFAALGSPEALHTGWGSDRYFFLGSTGFLLLIGLSRDGGSALRRRLATGAMALVVSNAVLQSLGAEWIKTYDVGPPVSAQVRACAGARPCVISYVPHGPGAEFPMDRTRIPGYRLPE